MNTAAQLSHDQHDPAHERSLREWADITGRKAESLMKTVRRKLGTGYNLDTPMSADQFDTLFSRSAVQETNPNQKPKTRNQTTQNPQPSAHPFTRRSVKREGGFDKRQAILYSLMAIPAVASVQNMYSVTGDIAAHLSTAILLTGLFSATPFLFVLAGMRTDWTKALTGLMIAYECFCNGTRIYGGLTGFGHGDYPTRFLGLVTDIFDTGTYATAKFLAATMAVMAAAVFYTAYYELNKKPRA